MMTKLPPFRTGKPRAEHGLVRATEEVEIPFAVIEGSRPGPRLLVTAGVHGSEFCSIETALRLTKLRPEELGGTLIVLPILNMRGFTGRSIYVMPEDGRNLNRVFPGKPDGTVSERLAHWLVANVYPDVDAYLDLHGGDLDELLVPFSLFPNGSEASLALASAFGLSIAVAAGGEGYTINAAHKLGVPGIIAEVSGNGLWGEESVGEMTAGVERVMKHLGMISKTVRPAARASRKSSPCGCRRPRRADCGIRRRSFPSPSRRAKSSARSGTCSAIFFDDLLEGGWFHPLSADQPVGEQG